MTRAEQRIGKHGESLAASALRSLGVEMVEKIGTPVIALPSKTPGLFRVIWEETVSGDHRGILPGGRSVLAETKTVLDRNLTWSDLREHQPDRLTAHADLGGLSFLVWVHASGIHIMLWPVAGFGPGKGITPAKAESLSITSLRRLEFIEYG